MQLEKFGGGSSVPTLNRNDVHAHKVALPSKAEQLIIASFFGAVDEKIDLLSKKKKQLEKYNIMKSDLLRLTKFTRCAPVRFAATGCSALRAQRSRTRRKRDACFCALPRGASGTKWLAAKTPPAISSCKFHVMRTLREVFEERRIRKKIGNSCCFRAHQPSRRGWSRRGLR